MGTTSVPVTTRRRRHRPRAPMATVALALSLLLSCRPWPSPSSSWPSFNVHGFQVRPTHRPHSASFHVPQRVAGTSDAAAVGGIRRSVAHLRAEASGGDDDTPFFARLADPISDRHAAAELPPSESDLPDSGGAAIAVAENSDTAKATTSSNGGRSALDIARDLRAQAKRTRLEAERMDTALTLEKINSLERRLENKTLKGNSKDDEADIRRQLLALNNKLRGPQEREEAKGSIVVAEALAKLNGKGFDRAEEKMGSEKTPPAMKALSRAQTILEMVESDLPPGLLNDINVTSATTMELEKLIPPMPEDLRKSRAEAFKTTPTVLQKITAKAAGFADARNPEAIVEQMYRDEILLELRNKQRAANGGKTEPLDQKQAEDALEGYMKLPMPIQDLIAKSVGMKDGRNATDVIQKLEADGKLFASDNGSNGFEINTESITDVDISGMFQEEERAAVDRYIETMLPKQTRKEGQIPTQEEVDVFFREVLGKDTFNPSEKPVPCPGGFLIKGNNRKKTGAELVSVMEEQLSKTSVAERLQFFYMIDPSPIRRDLNEIEMGEEKSAVIFVAGTDFTPDTNALVKPGVSALGLCTAVAYAMGTLALNEKALDKLYAQLDTGVIDFTWIQTMGLPILLALLGIQIAHEAAHQIVAVKDKFKAGLPTLVPSLTLGLTTAITPLESPPKDVNSLFDFAISGPLAGMAASTLLLIAGLSATVTADPTTTALFPSLPVSFLRSSSLVGGVVQWVLGEGILLTPDPSVDTILLHPLVVAGFAGMIANAMSLLPLGNTDGGRISQALFGRSWSRIVTTFLSLFMVLAGAFGLDDASIFLGYAFYASIWQREPEIPCRNEVDELEVTRGFLSIGVFVLVMLTLIPMS